MTAALAESRTGRSATTPTPFDRATTRITTKDGTTTSRGRGRTRSRGTPGRRETAGAVTAVVAVPVLPVDVRWLAMPPTATGPLHIGDTAAPWVPSESCSGGMGGSGGWPTRCDLLALPLWGTIDDAKITKRGMCPDCAATLKTTR